MTPEQFCYWLQGRAELMPDTPPTCAEWTMIREHLGAVFHKVTPPLGVVPKEPSITDLQRALQRGQTVTLPPNCLPQTYC